MRFEHLTKIRAEEITGEQTISDGMRLENKSKCSVCGERETVTVIDRGAGGLSFWCDDCLFSDDEGVSL